MSDQKQLFLFGQALPGNDSALLEKIQGCANFRNRYGASPTKVLEGIAASDILQTVVGHNHVAFLFSDFRVARLSFDIVQNKVESASASATAASAGSQEAGISEVNTSASATAQPSGGTSTTSGLQSTGNNSSSASFAAATAAANRTAKIRRVMMAARRPGGFCGRAGVIIDRARPLVPATSIPEELIAQAQVVLQGKSRDVIVRELQRTNLNVNEAVNNLLSRDDDEGDDLDETSEAYLHEELLSLLDAGLRTEGGGTSAIIDQDNIYASPEGYEYLMTRDLAKRREDTKSRNKASAESAMVLRDRIVFDESLQFWKGVDDTAFPASVKKFVKIASMHSELMALADNGKLYSWSWAKTAEASNEPHYINARLFGDVNNDERVFDLETCAWRAIVLTTWSRVAAFMDVGCGRKMAEIFFEPLVDIPDGETVESLHVSPLFSVVKTTNDRVYWRGIYPYNERRKIFEKARAKLRKHVTFEVNEIVEGSEVRTKSAPIYSAGCVGINFSSGVPMIGTLMESAWTLNEKETCRFRIQSPEQYDQLAENADAKASERKASFNYEGGASVTTPATAPVMEAPWSLKDVIFAKEEVVNDIAVVKIVDGAYCGVVFKSTLEKQKDGEFDSSLPKGLRLMRKDELIVVPSSGKTLRAPDNFQRHLMPIQLPSNVRRIIGMAVDSNGFRILVERKNRIHLIRMSCIGKLFSDHVMPICLSTLCKTDKDGVGKPRLENYGDDGVLFLRDACGNIVPLLRNAAGGFREPAFIGMARIHHMAIGLRYLKSADEINSVAISSADQYPPLTGKVASSKNANRLMIMAALVAPSPESAAPAIPSLMQAVLYCNLRTVRAILAQLSAEDESVRRAQIAKPRVDGNRNILHAAVMNAFSTTNKEQADIKTDNNSTGKLDTREADTTRVTFDRKWQEMLNAGNSNTPSKLTLSEPFLDQKDAKFEVGGPLANDERQANAIEIIKELVSHSVVASYLLDLMSERDTNEHTPFNCAVQMRAYSAAAILLNSAESLTKSLKRRNHSDSSSASSDSTLQDPANVAGKSATSIIELINGIKPDDSPLFVLCYNDTCSFTWTGEEHVNQDIFECKTCGLTGTFCCCTECAYTCHRNHDCKLKRTSPTAYCDCWVKCSCKALVSGNTAQREALLVQLLHSTNLIRNLNSKGEHLLLFLAKTVGRQLVEQENFVRHVSKSRSAQAQPATGSSGNAMPEHDLDPPKFARRALELALGNWSAVKSLLEVGLKHTSDESIVVEDIYHLGEQHGSTHLDKFVFTLLARCQESHLDILLNTLVEQANLRGDERDLAIDSFILRFVRSVVRLFTLIIVISPAAAGFILSTIACTLADPSNAAQLCTSTNAAAPANGGSSKTILSNYRAVAISGMLSLVRASLPSAISSSTAKESKKKSLTAFISKTRRVFQVLVTYSITEIINASDAYIAPVRLGMLKPAAFVLPNDVLDLIERYLNTEKDLSTLLMNSESVAEFLNKSQKKKFNDNTLNTISGVEHRAGAGDSDSDSESDNDDQPSRRLNSQSSVTGANDETPAAVLNTTSGRPLSYRERRAAAANRRRTQATMIIGDDSTDSLSSPSGEESDNDDEDDEDEESSESKDLSHRIGNLNEGDTNNDDEDDEDEEREMEDEEEDAYFNMDDEEEVESAGDAEGDDIHNEAANPGDSNDIALVNQDEVPVELMDITAPLDPVDDANSTAARVSDYSPTISAGEEESGSAGGGGPVSGGNPITSGESLALRASATRASSIGSSNTAARTRGFALNWAVNRIRQEGESGIQRDAAADGQQSESARNENRANVELEVGSTTAATVGSQGTSTTSGAPSRNRYRGSNTEVQLEDLSNHAAQMSMQLTMAFSVLIKLADELMLELSLYSDWCKGSHKGIKSVLLVDDRIASVLKKIINERLEPTWRWLYTIMDRMEARLKFGNSLMSSAVGSLISMSCEADKSAKSADKKEEKRSRKLGRAEGKRGLALDADSPSNMNKVEFCNYFLSLLRSHSSENGDDLPTLEYNSLKAVTFVVEAYLFHVNMMDELEVKAAESQEKEEEKMDVDSVVANAKSMRRFYQRSKSICYPYISTADKHHAFKYSANDCLPLATRAHLLQPEVERGVLFALPVPHRTRGTHRQVAEEHGIAHPTHQSLADPPIRYSDLLKSEQQQQQQTPMENEARKTLEPMDISSNDGNSAEKTYHEDFNLDLLLGERTSVSRVVLQRCLGRWSNTTLFLSKAFHENIIASCGGDASLSILLNETAGYHIRQMQFRRRMEKFKTAQTKELTFSQMSREKNALLTSTIRQLNQNYARRNASSASSGVLADGSPNPVLASNKVKVTFRDEPGEGTGVARSFYAAIADALHTMHQLPPDLNPTNEDGTSATDDFGGGGGSGGSSEGWSSSRRPQASTSPTRNFFSRLSKRANRQVSEGNADSPSMPDYRIRTRSQRSTTSIFQPAKSGSSSSIQSGSSRRSANNKNKNSDETMKSDESKTSESSGDKNAEVTPIPKRDPDLLPLFYRPSKSGHYTPIPGSNSSTRLNAFRNVGRLIGICLQQMEILPLFLCRHILKYILGRSITWFDLAFYDPDLFNSLRSIVFNDAEETSHDPDHFKNLYLTFAVEGSSEEGETGILELKPNGDKISVTKENVLEYIYLFVQQRLLGRHVKCLEAIRRGVFDVIPPDSLDQLTSEDLRLILCGNQDISVTLLESYTTFSDESSAAAEVLTKYKPWFWSVLHKFNSVEKQDLVFFWTGSPALPSTEESFQPLPSIVIRPADDHHLPTANTCISRLYLPLYSSKKILRAKLLLAIKARNFGFV